MIKNSITKKSNNINKITGILAIFVLLWIVGWLFETEFRTFEGYSIDEVIDKKYSGFNCEYIKSQDYYFVWGYSKISGTDFNEIIHLNDDGKYVFFSSGYYPLKNKFKYFDTEKLSLDTLFGVYKEKNQDIYVLAIYIVYNKKDVIILDNQGEWECIKVFINDDVGSNYYWFKVIDGIDEDYVIYLKDGQGQKALVTKEDIIELYN